MKLGFFDIVVCVQVNGDFVVVFYLGDWGDFYQFGFVYDVVFLVVFDYVVFKIVELVGEQFGQCVEDDIFVGCIFGDLIVDFNYLGVWIDFIEQQWQSWIIWNVMGCVVDIVVGNVGFVEIFV